MSQARLGSLLLLPLAIALSCAGTRSVKTNEVVWAAGGSGTGGNYGSTGGQASLASVTEKAPDSLLDTDRTTVWKPGILRDDQLNLALGKDGLPVRMTVCARPKPGDDVAAAIANCPEGHVVQLSAGLYQISSTITLSRGVVLRGAGSKGVEFGGTTLRMTNAGPAISIGTERDQACYSNAFGSPHGFAQNALKETTELHVGLNSREFYAGDLALIDQVDDSKIQEGDCKYFKRVDRRSVSERVEVASVDNAKGTLTLTTPLHWTFKSPRPYMAEIARVKGKVTKWAGVEALQLQGGNNPGYNGQMAGGIDVSNAAYCWIKDVQTDGTTKGIHIALTGTYRCVVRDSHIHHSANYGFGADCYGIVLRCGAADNLVENNIVRYMNKPIQFSVSGGGNVVGYNYVDNSWAEPPAFQEDNFDTHCSFPHMELMEGNYVPHMKASSTHGNSGFLTYFRNYASSQFASPPVFGSSAKQTGNVLAVGFDPGDLNMTVVGNVLGSSKKTDIGTAPISDTYRCFGPGGACIFQFGANAQKDVSFTTLMEHGNYDTVNDRVVWNPTITNRVLPDSLYLSAKPAWWPSEGAWPWVGPDLNPMVGSLPAKTRSGLPRRVAK